jgi:hypothetical protein
LPKLLRKSQVQCVTCQSKNDATLLIGQVAPSPLTSHPRASGQRSHSRVSRVALPVLRRAGFLAPSMLNARDRAKFGIDGDQWPMALPLGPALNVIFACFRLHFASWRREASERAPGTPAVPLTNSFYDVHAHHSHNPNDATSLRAHDIPGNHKHDQGN